MAHSGEITPGKWLLATAVAVAGVIAVGYLAGNAGNKEENAQVVEQQSQLKQQLSHRACTDDELNESEIRNGPSGDANEHIDAYLSQVYYKFSTLTKAHRYPEACELGEKFLVHLKRRYGSDQIYYYVISLDIAQAFIDAKQEDRAIEILTLAFNGLLPTPDMPVDEFKRVVKPCVKCCLKLSNLVTPLEGIGQAEQLFVALERWIEIEPESLEAKELYFLWACHLIGFYRTLGYWAKTEAVYRQFEAKKDMVPDEIRRDILDSYAASVHLQGKTVDVLAMLQDYFVEKKEKSNWALVRLAKFYFYLDMFEKSEAALERLYDNIRDADRGKGESLASFTELMTVKAELGKEEDFKKLDAIIRQLVPDAKRRGTCLFVRSKYLITQESSITDHYHFMLKVCIQRPCRPEGEYELPEEDLLRKLSSFYLEAHFQHPQQGKDDIVIGKEVNHYDVLLDSPVFDTPFEPHRWYSTDCYLYRDASKSEYLGRHYQLIYYEPKSAKPSTNLYI